VQSNLLKCGQTRPPCRNCRKSGGDPADRRPKRKSRPSRGYGAARHDSRLQFERLSPGTMGNIIKSTRGIDRLRGPAGPWRVHRLVGRYQYPRSWVAGAVVRFSGRLGRTGSDRPSVGAGVKSLTPFGGGLISPLRPVRLFLCLDVRQPMTVIITHCCFQPAQQAGEYIKYLHRIGCDVYLQSIMRLPSRTDSAKV
jgi:hypothetical protein